MTNLNFKLRNMNRMCFLFPAVLAVCGPLTVWATQDTWVNNGTIVGAPTIDATNVINNGTITLASVPAFDTSNTRNFTNSGSMLGSIGFRFDTAPRNSTGQLIGLRKPSANFHNRNSGIISALDGSTLGGFNGSVLFVESTNIVNQGILTVDAGGLLQLTGTNVNVSRGGFGVLSIDSGLFTTSANDSPANGVFTPATAVTDNYWAQANVLFRVDGLISPAGVVSTPVHNVETVGAGGYINQNVALSLNSYFSDAISNVLQFASITATNLDGSVTNYLVPTNVLQQAAFVAVPNGNFSPTIQFIPTTIVTNEYFSVVVTVGIPTTNVITGQIELTTVHLQDTLAGELDRGLLNNYLTTLGGQGIIQTRRPRAYLLSRAQQAVGLPGNAVVTPEFFYSTDSITNRVTGDFAAYSASFDNIVVRPPLIPAGTATNITGRAEVRAAVLDMTQARIRGEGLISIQTQHLVGSSNALVDCENLSLDVGNTNGLLRIQNLTKTTAQRVRGDVFAWSAQWTNGYQMVLTNYVPATDTNDPPVLTPITNTVGVQYHMLVYDMSALTTVVPAVVQQFRATATNIVMEDQANVVLDFLLKGQSFTLNGGLTLSGAVPDWFFTNAPTLRYFTNNGNLSVANEAHFGDDGPTNYATFVNRGNITSVGQNIDSDYVELAGTNIVSAAISIVANDTKVETGRVSAGGDILFTTDTLKFNRALIQAGDRLILTVPDALFDNGVSSSNTVTCGDGLILGVKPAIGDLLGTSLQTIAPNFALVDHFWAGEDRGATPAGFLNNVALGRLTPVPAGFLTAFGFTGMGVANGLYVDLLDLSQLPDYANQLLIDPNLTIYYAAARLSFVPSGGVTPEEYLDQQLGGRLRWVSQYTGPNSTVDVVINGNQTIQVNKALRNSTTIDSDSDGIPNFFDLTPFDGVTITSIARSTAPAGYVISWDGAPNTVYRVEYKTGLNSVGWTPLLMTTNVTAAPMAMSVVDTNLVAGQQRYYRVSYNPNGP